MLLFLNPFNRLEIKKKTLIFKLLTQKSKQNHMNLQELKQKSAEFISEAEKLGIENPHLRKQEILFAIQKNTKKMNKLPLLEFWRFYKMVSVF